MSTVEQTPKTTTAVGKMPPGPSSPGFLQSLQWLLRPVGYLEHLNKRYGETFMIQLVPLGRFVSFSNPEHIKQIFTASPNVLHAGEGNMVLEPIVGKHSLLILDRAKHLRQRRLMLPPFHGERLQGFLDRIDQIANEAIDEWSAGDEFVMREKTQAIALDVILEVIFGLGHEDRARKQQFRDGMIALSPESYQRTIYMPFRIPLPGGRDPHTKFERGKQKLDELILDEVAKRRQDPAAAKREDVMSMLLQAKDDDGNPMTEEEILDELVTLVVAGHETTSTALSWIFELLYRHPEAMRRATEEAKAGEHEYLDAVVREALRVRPAISMAVRRVKEDVEIGGYMLPAGTALGANIFLTHMREDVYEDAKAFKPERFLGESPGTYSWYPFGGGTRRCIGANFALFEMRTILAAILRRVELRSPDGKPERIVRRAIVTLSPKRDTRTVVVSVAPGPQPVVTDPREATAAA